MKTYEVKHFHLFSGLGGGARGFNQGTAEIPGLVAKFRCIGGVDVDPAGVRDFRKLSGVPGTLLDLFDREQYVAFHGEDPPAGWREAGPDDIRRAAGEEFPNIVFLSAPCKGFSGLLSEKQSHTDKYQALNRLTLRGVWLMLEAFQDNLPEFVLFENVPRIQNRGRPLLDQIQGLLHQYGYAVALTVHDCGEIGGLAQRRKRFLLVARHQEKVRPFLYEPPKRALLPVGDILGKLPMPGGELGGPMHRVSQLQWKTWVRLAFVEAGKDWRSLNRLRVKDGVLQDYLLVPDMNNTVYGVTPWDKPAGTITSRSAPTTGRFSVADPRFSGAEYGQYGVRGWKESTGTVTSQSQVGQGGFSVADPRLGTVRHNNVYRVIRYDEPSGTVTGGAGPTSGGLAVADPRPGWGPAKKDYRSGGHYGVVPWGQAAGAVTSAAGHDSGRWSVADPRPLPAGDQKLVARIIAEDGTWHRPFTTLELAALQGLINPDGTLELDGESDTAWRERIGNAVPPPAATAIASEMGRAFLLAKSGRKFEMGSTPIWVRPLVVALSVNQQMQ